MIIDISGNFINQTTPKWTIQNLFRNSNLYPASASSIPNQASCYVNEFIHRNHSVNCAGMVEWDPFECPATNRILLLNFMQTPHGGGNIIYFCRCNHSLFLYTLTKSRRTLAVPGQFLGVVEFLNGNEWSPLRTSFVINFRFWREALFPLTTTTNIVKKQHQRQPTAKVTNTLFTTHLLRPPLQCAALPFSSYCSDSVRRTCKSLRPGTPRPSASIDPWASTCPHPVHVTD